MEEVGKDKATGIVRVRVDPKFYRPTEVVSALSLLLCLSVQSVCLSVYLIFCAFLKDKMQKVRNCWEPEDAVLDLLKYHLARAQGPRFGGPKSWKQKEKKNKERRKKDLKVDQ